MNNFFKIVFRYFCRLSISLESLYVSEWYRVPIKKLCFFPKNCLYFATSPSPALGCCYWLYKNCQPIRVTVHSDLLRGWVVLLLAGDGLQRTRKNAIFNERPVLKAVICVFFVNCKKIDLFYLKKAFASL